MTSSTVTTPAPTRCPDGKPHAWVAAKLALPGETLQSYRCKRRKCGAKKALPRHFEDVDRRRTMQASAEQAVAAKATRQPGKKDILLW